MKRALKLLGKIVLVLVAIPVVFYLFLVLYNLRDDALDPELEKLLASAPPQIDPATNGYFAWLGVVGPADQDPHAWGRRWYAEALEADKKAVADLNTSITLAIEAEKRKSDLKTTDIPCAAKIETCLEAVAAKPEDARAALEKGKVVLERGDAALAYPAYQEAWRPDAALMSPIPSYTNFYRQLSAPRFALAVAEGRHDQALEQLGREMAFHTRQMQGAVSLIEKMVAIASLRNNYQLLSQYLLAYPAEAKIRAERLAALFAPLPTDALRLQPTLLNEQRISARLILSLKGVDDAMFFGSAESDGKSDALVLAWALGHLGRPLLLANATANEYVGYQRALIAADALTGAAYRDMLAKAKAETAAAGETTYSLRNPIGHLLNGVALPNYSAYYLKRDDLAMLQAALALQLDLLRRDADDPSIGQAVTALIHPYTGVAPAWDGAKRTLTFPALPERQNKPLTLHF
ncbi:hypothetical protein EG831_00210 [bacterium]|nr:hypothetical protein [bacterium]